MAVSRESGGLKNVGLEVFSRAFDAMSADAIGALSRRVLDQVLARPPYSRGKP